MLRVQIGANTKQKVTEIFNAAKDGDELEFNKLIDEIEEKAVK